MEIPNGPANLTAEWLTAALLSSGVNKNTKVKSFGIRRAAEQKGILGQIVRIDLQYEPSDVTAPRSLIAKFPPADTETRIWLHNMGSLEKEVRFYQQISGQIQLHTPCCFYSDIDTKTGACVILMEDLAPARNGDRIAGCTVDEAALAIREIAGFHAKWWENQRLQELGWLRVMSGGDFWSSVGRDWPLFLQKAGKRIDASLVVLGERIMEHAASLVGQLREPPLTLVHNDFQLENLFFSVAEDRPSLSVIDWQFVSRGRGAADVALFLCQNVSIEIRRACEGEFLKAYHDILTKHGVLNYSYDQCIYDYRLSVLDWFGPLIGALGGGWFEEEQEQAILDSVMPRHIAALFDLDVLALLPR